LSLLEKSPCFALPTDNFSKGKNMNNQCFYGIECNPFVMRMVFLKFIEFLIGVNFIGFHELIKSYAKDRAVNNNPPPYLLEYRKSAAKSSSKQRFFKRIFFRLTIFSAATIFFLFIYLFFKAGIVK